jgi:hypothetical protein
VSGRNLRLQDKRLGLWDDVHQWFAGSDHAANGVHLQTNNQTSSGCADERSLKLGPHCIYLREYLCAARVRLAQLFGERLGTTLGNGNALQFGFPNCLTGLLDQGAQLGAAPIQFCLRPFQSPNTRKRSKTPVSELSHARKFFSNQTVLPLQGHDLIFVTRDPGAELFPPLDQYVKLSAHRAGTSPELCLLSGKDPLRSLSIGRGKPCPNLGNSNEVCALLLCDKAGAGRLQLNRLPDQCPLLRTKFRGGKLHQDLALHNPLAFTRQDG